MRTNRLSGIGFAIPYNAITKIVPILIDKGYYPHAYLHRYITTGRHLSSSKLARRQLKSRKQRQFQTCIVLQCTHYIIMLQNMVLFMAPLEGPSPEFILCDKCLWCATYFDKTRLLSNRCLQCGANNIEPLPIMSNESFTFNNSDKRGGTEIYAQGQTQ